MQKPLGRDIDRQPSLALSSERTKASDVIMEADDNVGPKGNDACAGTRW